MDTSSLPAAPDMVPGNVDTAATPGPQRRGNRKRPLAVKALETSKLANQAQKKALSAKEKKAVKQAGQEAAAAARALMELE